MIKLTLAIPTYNGGKNLSKLVKNCSKNLQLRKSEYEILVVDNASNDGSIEELQKSKVKNLRIVKNKRNLGRVGNWNKCVREAKGEYFIYVFTNDKLAPENNIPDVLKILDKNSDIGLVISQFNIHIGSYNRLGRNYLYRPKIVDSEKFLKEQIEHSLYPCGPLQSLIYRTKDLKKFKFDEKRTIMTDQIVSTNYALKFDKIYLNPVAQMNWIATKKRYASNVDLFTNVKEIVDAIDEINLKVDLRKYYTYHLIGLYYGSILKTKNLKLFRKTELYIRNKVRKNGFKLDFYFFRFIPRVLRHEIKARTKQIRTFVEEE